MYTATIVTNKARVEFCTATALEATMVLTLYRRDRRVRDAWIEQGGNMQPLEVRAACDKIAEVLAR